MNRYISVFTNKRMLISLLLGFSSGLPLALVGETLQAWLSKSNIDIKTLGMFALVGLPYALKFLWAPIMDHKPLPFLGLRRGWMATTQVGLFAATIGLAFSDPVANISTFSIMCLLVAFFSASQDIVVDAYRTEIIEDKAEYGAGASTYITGYRIATIVSGGLALILADHTNWTTVYVAMAFVNLVGLATILLSKEPAVTRKKTPMNFKDSTVRSFLEFFQRRGAMDILIFIMVYKISTLMATALTTKFLVSLDFSLTAIGAARKGPGFFATIFGVLSGGALMAKLGMKQSLWIFGVIQSLVGLTFWLLAHLSATQPEMKEVWLVVIMCMDNYMMGLGTAALTGFMMNFCNREFTGTQYALLTSVMAVSRVILVAQAGTLVDWLGWETFFILTVPLAIPGLLLLSRYDHWQTMATHELEKKIPTFDWIMIAGFASSLIALSIEPIFRWQNMPEVGTKVTLFGAYGIVAVVVAGIVRPFLSTSSGRLKTT